MSEFKSKMPFLVVAFIISVVLTYHVNKGWRYEKELNETKKELYLYKSKLYYVTFLNERGDTILHIYSPYQPTIPNSRLMENGFRDIEIWVDRGGKLDIWTSQKEGGWRRK